MIDIAQILSSLIRMSSPLVCVAGVASFLILIEVDRVITFLDLSPIRNQGKPYLSIVLIFAVSYFAVKVATSIYDLSLKAKDKRREMRRLSVRIKNLTGEERRIIAGYIERDSRTAVLSIIDGVAAGLEKDGLIYRASAMAASDVNFAYNINAAVWDYLKQHPELIER